MDQLLLAVRVVVSLAVVLGLMWALSRATRGRGTARTVPLEIVSRAALGKKSSVVVLRVSGRGLVVGVTEHSVALLTEIELEPLVDAAEERTPLDLTTALLADPFGATSTAGSSTTYTPAHADTAAPQNAGHHAAHAAHAAPGGATPLAGSVLSPQTWRDMAGSLRERSVRS